MRIFALTDTDWKIVFICATLGGTKIVRISLIPTNQNCVTNAWIAVIVITAIFAATAKTAETYGIAMIVSVAATVSDALVCRGKSFIYSIKNIQKKNIGVCCRKSEK